MPTAIMRRCRVVITGVAGSPYYVNGYFDSEQGTVQQSLDAWMTFVAGATSGTNLSFPSGSTWTAESAVTLIDPVTGDAVGVQNATARVVTGGGSGPFLPPSNQLLMRWHTNNYEAGREVRGRTNIPCVLESASTNSGTVEPATITGANAAAATLIASATASFVIWSKKNGLWWAAESGSCWSQFAVLRSRRD